MLDAGVLRVGRDDDPIVRIKQLCADVRELVKDTQPSVIVIEVTSGKAAGRLNNRKVQGLGVYGMAVGAIWREAVWIGRMRIGGPRLRVALVYENEWTQGEPKAKRHQRITMLLPEHAERLTRDTGGDVTDAIGLGLWWIAREAREARVQ